MRSNPTRRALSVDFRDDAGMNRFIVDDAAFADFLAPGFELRLDERNDPSLVVDQDAQPPAG